jgi:hypothetical protein
MAKGPFIPFRGFTPSVDPTLPGAVLACQNLVPTVRGMRAAYAPTPFGNPAFSKPVTGAATCELLTGAYRTFAGTSTDLFEVVNGANNNVSFKAGGYTAGTNRWRFVQFGNATVATDGSDPLQQSISSGNFNPIGDVGSLTLGSGGGSYTSAPTVTISPPASGVGTAATASATISSGAVSGLTLLTQGEGYGYGEVATVSFSGGGGSGATATAMMNSAPIANILEVVQGFVFALGTADPVNGSRPHGWYCSGLYDQTQWTPSQATQCANGIIVDQPGAITAGKALGTNIIVYKAQSMFYGVYQGPPVIWSMNQISPIVGTPCQECVVPVGASHFFLGTDKQVYEFDGTIPVPIGDEVHDWLAANWSSSNQSVVQSYYDQPNSLVYWYFVSNNSSNGTIDTCLVYNHRTGKFGRADLPIQAAVQAISGQITWSAMGSLPGVSTWSTLPQVPYNSTYWSQSSPSQGIIDATNTLQSLTGASTGSSLTTSWLGDDYNYVDYLGFVPRFSQQPATCTGIGYTQEQLGLNVPPTQWSIGPYYDGELAADFSARYCQTKLSFTGNHEVLGMTPRVAGAGEI